MGYMIRAFDSLVNVLSGLGVPGRDKAASEGSTFVYTPMSRGEMDAAYRSNWMARKLIDIPAQDATRAWRAWQTDTNVVEKLEEEEARLNLQVVLKNALIMARLYGGAALVLGVKQGTSAQALNYEKIKKGDLLFVMPLSRWQLGYGPLVRDVTLPDFGKPEYFTHNAAGGPLREDGYRIHPSRVIMLQGMTLPDPLEGADIWGDSVLQIVRDAVQSATLVTQAVATLVTEAKIDIIKIPDLSQNIATEEYQRRLTSRFIYANTAKSIINTLVLDKEEDWDRKEADFSQLPELLQMYLLIAAGAADIPATRMLGQSPAGLQSTGESDVRNYYDRVNSDQTNVLSPALAGLDDVFIRSALGSRDPSIYYVWNPLWQMSAEVKAAVAKQKADAANVDSMMGLVDPEALRIGRQNQLIEDGTYPGLEQALEEQDLLDLESMQSVEEQEAQAEAERRKQIMMGGGLSNQMPGQQGPAKGGPPQKQPFGGRDALRPTAAARRTVRLGGRRRITRDYNENHDPDTGRFTGEGGAGYSGPSSGSADPYQRQGPTGFHPGVLSAAHTSVYNPRDEPKGRRLEARRAQLSAAVDRYKTHPESRRVQRLMEEHATVMKDLRRLNLDPGGLAGVGKFGGARDVVVIGGGPAGLNALINSAYENLDAVLVEAQSKVGGQARASSGVKNVAGTPYGTKGDAYFDKMHSLAQLNGGEIRTNTRVTGITYDKATGLKTVHLDNGETMQSRTVILAGGVQFRTEKFEGADGPGVYYGDGSAMTDFTPKGGTAIVVGGSNGAAQAAIGAANAGTNVVVLARSGLDKMSGDPRKVLETHPRIKVITGTVIDKLERDSEGKPKVVVTKDGQRIPTDAIGLFLGQAPSTKWLPPEIEVNGAGFVRADVNLRATMPGVFVPGDMRDNGPQRVQLSGGEGQKAVKEVFTYFAEQGEAEKRGDPAPHESAWVRHLPVSELEQKQMLSERESLLAKISELQEKLNAFGSHDAEPGQPDRSGKMSMKDWDESVDLLNKLDAEFPYILQCIEESEDDDTAHRYAGLRDFNQNHEGAGSERGGQFSSGSGGGGGSALTKGGTKTAPAPKTAGEPGAKKTDITQNMAGEYDVAARQPTSDLDQLYSMSRKAEPGFQKTVEEFAAKFGGTVVYQSAETAEPGTRMKHRTSAERKVKSEYGGDAAHIRDVLRATVVLEDAARARESVADFVTNNDVVRVKDRFMTPMGGYRDLMLNFRTPEGLITELQFSTPHLLEAKNGEGHKLYQATRSLTTKSERKPDDDVVIAENIARSEMLYAAAYDADGDGCGWQRDC